MKTAAPSLLLALVLSAISAPVFACGIVYGSDWSFASVTPKGWDSACAEESVEGTAVTIWPHGQTMSTANGLIYVTVSEKVPADLKAFADDEQVRFKQSSPTSHVSVLKAPNQSGKYKYILSRIEDAPGKHEEIVAYMDGPTAFYIVVLSADSPALLNSYKAAFLEYVENFTPMANGQH